MMPNLRKVTDESGTYYVDEEDVLHESPELWVWAGILGGCGCGNAGELGKKAIEMLAFDGFRQDCTAEDEILLHWLDSKGLLEHGSCIYGSWRTPRGEAVLRSIKGCSRSWSSTSGATRRESDGSSGALKSQDHHPLGKHCRCDIRV